MKDWVSTYDRYMTDLEREEKFKSSQLANEMTASKLKEQEDARKIKTAIFDLIQGYGTPGERAEELGRPITGMQQALQSGGKFTNITPEGRYEGGGKKIGGMRDIQPRPMGGMASELMRKSVGLPPESPESEQARAMELQGEAFRRTEETQRGAEARQDVRLKAQSAEQEKRLTATEELANKRNQANLVGQFHIARTNSLDISAQRAQAEFDKIQSNYLNAASSGRLVMPGAEEAWKGVLTKAEETLNAKLGWIEKERQAINTKMKPFLQELGIPTEEEQPQQGEESPEITFDKMMIKTLDPILYTSLTTSGWSAGKIIRQAQAVGTSPEEFLQDIINARIETAGEETTTKPITPQVSKGPGVVSKNLSSFLQERRSWKERFGGK